MTLEIPEIQDTDFAELLAEARARIPVHNPEWTNFNESDPGITILELFAFMTESLLYRANRIPERNRIKFLQLLDVPMQPAMAAEGIVAFENTRGPLTAVTVANDTELLAGKVPFRTQATVEVLPLEAAVFYKAALATPLDPDTQARYRALYTDLAPEGAVATFYETRRLEPPTPGGPVPSIELATDTIDGSLWLALLARDAEPTTLSQTRNAIGGRELTVGIVPTAADAERVLFPESTRRTTDDPGIELWMPAGGSLPEPPASRAPSYVRLEVAEEGDVIVEPGMLRVILPAASDLQLWDNLEPAEEGVGTFPPLLDDSERGRLITWIRLKRPVAEGSADGRLSATLSWVGINATRVAQRARVVGERLTSGTGGADQVVKLANTPAIAGTVTVTVGTETWSQTDDLLAAGSELDGRNNAGEPAVSTVFVVDRFSGEIRFGNGIHGSRPPAGAIIRATYEYGGGPDGNVPAGAVSKGPSLPAGIKVTNGVPTWGGAEAETVPEAERRMSQFVRHRNRLVSSEDFSVIAHETPGVDIARVEVLPLVHPSAPTAESPGVVTLLAIPRHDPAQPEAPRPDQLFLDAVCDHLDERRLVTTELHVRGPVYRPIVVSIGLDAAPGASFPQVRDAVQRAVKDFLSPIPLPNDDSTVGWPLGKAVDPLEIWTVAARVTGVARISAVLVGDTTTLSPLTRVEMGAFELPHVVGLSVQPGDPAPLDDLVGVVAPPDGTVLPIPTVPEEC